MKPDFEYEITGNLKCDKEMDFEKTPLAVQAVIEGKEVASTEVDRKGGYRLNFEGEGVPRATELRIVPNEFLKIKREGVTFGKKISANRFTLRRKEEKSYTAHYDLRIPKAYYEGLLRFGKKYHMHGTVWAVTGDPPTSVDPVPGLKIEFFEAFGLTGPIFFPYQYQKIQFKHFYFEHKLGYTYTDPDGSYDFSFFFGYPNMYFDKIPDVRARIYQLVSGVWTEIYTGPVDWNIVDDFHRDYFIPVDDVHPVIDEGVPPTEGFRFNRIGFLPVDDTRIVNGYATAKSSDLPRIQSIRHQPFCGTLHIHGYFATAPQVTHYKVQVATATATTPTGTWEDVTDPVFNAKWNDTTKSWDTRVFAADPTTHLYENIDIENYADWLYHAKKISWQSNKHSNGYYALRVVGYDSGGTEVGSFQMPIMRIDNTLPSVDFDVASSHAVTDCGHTSLLPGNKMQLKVTAFDNEGHMLRYRITGTRGKKAEAAGSMIEVKRLATVDTWNGNTNHTEEFTAWPLPAHLAGCPSVAYNFELRVRGSATNGIDVMPQYTRKDLNLIIS